MRRFGVWPRALGAATAVAALNLVAPTVARAGDPVAEAQARLDQARAEAHDAARRLDDARAQRLRTEAEIASVAEAIPQLRAREALLRDRIGDRAAALYRNTDPTTSFQVTGEGDPVDGARRTRLTEAATEYDTATVHELRGTVEELVRAQAELELRRAQLDQVIIELDRARAELDRKVGVAGTALWRATVVGALRARGTTYLMGPSALAADEIAGWLRSTRGPGRVAGITVEELAAIYVEEGDAAGVRGDIAFAQSVIETGSFGSIGPNNFAGLGACDSCTDMTHFPTARDGVRAQMQHLRNYADAGSRSTELGYPPSPYWYGGDPGTAAANFDGFFAKGWAPTWEEMGAGNWATDPGYASKVLGVYDRMLRYGLV